MIVRTRLVNIALLAVLVFAVSRLWLFLGQPPPSLPAVSAGASPPAESATEREQKEEVPEIPPETYDVIVARDLFRRPRGRAPRARRCGKAGPQAGAPPRN